MTIGSPATVEAVQSPVDTSAGADRVAFPTRRDEAWRYAPHTDLGRLVFGPSPEAAPAIPAEVESQIPSLDGPRIVVVNGVVDPTNSDLAELPDGLHVASLATAAQSHPDLVSTHFAPRPDGPADAFVAMNQTYGRDGAFVHVADGCRLDQPIHIVDIAVPDTPVDGTPGDAAENTAPNTICSGVVIHLGAGSAATVVETHLGAGTAVGGTNTHTTVTLHDGAALAHLSLQDLPAEQVQLSRIEVNQGPGSELRAHSFNLGGAYGRIDYQVRLKGEGALAELSGLYFGFGEQTLDQQITIIHEAGDCTSRQAFRGVLDDRSTGVFNGGIMVSPGADGTDAEQANDNLLLSTQADVNTQPRLEILADDVACKHGATVGQLDDGALYYLRSRGIPVDEARQLLIAGFADQTVEEIEFDSVRAWIIDRLGHGHA